MRYINEHWEVDSLIGELNGKIKALSKRIMKLEARHKVDQGMLLFQQNCKNSMQKEDPK